MEHINIFGPINQLGYGIHCINMVKAMIDFTDSLYLSPIGPIQNEASDKDLLETLTKPAYFKANSPSLFIFHDQFASQFTGIPRIVFSVFELDRISNGSKNMLNQCDMVFTTTKAHKEILEKCGVKTPVHVVHEGINTLDFNMYPCKPLINTGKPTFITVGKNEKRKNTDKIIKAFIDVAMYKETTLICHTFNPFLAQKNKSTDLRAWTGIPQEISSMGFQMKEQAPDYIKFTNGCCDLFFTKPIPKAKMRSLYTSAQVGIQCSSAEGWDLPLNELLGCGIPCITTDCLGHREFLPGDIEPQRALRIDCESSWTEEAKDDMWFKGGEGNWYNIPLDKIREKIEYVLESDVKGPYQALSNYIRDNFTWKKAAETVTKILS